jgi:hypothetical protein
VVTTPNTRPKTPFATADEPISTSTCRRAVVRMEVYWFHFVCSYMTKGFSKDHLFNCSGYISSG